MILSEQVLNNPPPTPPSKWRGVAFDEKFFGYRKDFDYNDSPPLSKGGVRGGLLNIYLSESQLVGRQRLVRIINNQ